MVEDTRNAFMTNIEHNKVTGDVKAKKTALDILKGYDDVSEIRRFMKYLIIREKERDARI